VISPEAQIQGILERSKTIAVVGLSPDEARDSHQVAAYMQRHGYRVIPVNPNVKTVLGERAYGSLREVPEPIDLIDVFRRPEFVPAIVEEAIAIQAPALWLQLGVVHEAAARRAQQAGIAVVMDRCLMVEHRRLFVGE
jgi:predicted CoA-binding protein